MFRVVIIFLVIGGVMIFFGYREYQVSAGASTEPVPVALAEIEGGKHPDNTHIVLDAHVRLYPAAVFQYEAPEGHRGDPQPDHTVNYTYYPVISGEHPFILALIALEDKYGTLDKAPEAEFPPLESVAVLVKTERFKYVRSIPEEIKNEETLRGLVISRIESLDGDEERLVRQSFPKIDIDRIVIVEEGRKPKSSAFYYGLMGGGAGVILVGLVLIKAASGKSKKTRRQPRRKPPPKDDETGRDPEADDQPRELPDS